MVLDAVALAKPREARLWVEVERINAAVRRQELVLHRGCVAAVWSLCPLELARAANRRAFENTCGVCGQVADECVEAVDHAALGELILNLALHALGAIDSILDELDADVFHRLLAERLDHHGVELLVALDGLNHVLANELGDLLLEVRRHVGDGCGLQIKRHHALVEQDVAQPRLGAAALRLGQHHENF